MKVHRTRMAPTARSAAAPASLVTATNDATARARVDARELRIARAAVAKLPAADRALLATHRLTVELVPRSSLEDGMLGATEVRRGPGDGWQPTRIRVASRIEGDGVESLAEVVQHEIGHALAVIRAQDRSEDAAGRYARRW